MKLISIQRTINNSYNAQNIFAITSLKICGKDIITKTFERIYGGGQQPKI